MTLASFFKHIWTWYARKKARDFTGDPIRPVIKDGHALAEDTTLGANNGIGIALILAALEDASLIHDPLEALLTADEEDGMGGTAGIQASTSMTNAAMPSKSSPGFYASLKITFQCVRPASPAEAPAMPCRERPRQS